LVRVFVSTRALVVVGVGLQLLAILTTFGATTILSLSVPAEASSSATPSSETLSKLTCHGSLLGHALNEPIESIGSTPDAGGYWLVAADGGVFSFGDAGYFGSMGGRPLSRPVVGMASTADGKGYWLVAADGGVFSFGDAGYFGSEGSANLSQPIIGMAGTSDGSGYWLAAADGGIFAFGNATFLGSGPQIGPDWVTFAAFSVTSDFGGYILGSADRGVELVTFGDARYAGVDYAPNDDSLLVGFTPPAASDNYAYLDATAAGGVDLNDPGPAIGLGSRASC
jgi:hypothetical protein